MAEMVNTTRDYPSTNDLEDVRKILKPPGILSNNYNKSGLKKVERPYISAKDIHSMGKMEPMYQSNHQSISGNSLGESYFNATTKRYPQSTFDRINHVTEGYNQRLHRDDRHHAKALGLRLHEEENRRSVPCTSNAIYGRTLLPQVDRMGHRHGHTDVCQQDFYRNCGVETKWVEE